MGVSPRWTARRGRRRLRRPRRRSSGSSSSGGSSSVAGRPSWLNVEASALPTSVAVMAPALTEAGPQKAENLLKPAGGFLSAEQAKQVCLSATLRPTTTTATTTTTSTTAELIKVCQNREILAQFVVSANVQPSKIDEQCLYGIPKDLINDVINLKFGSGFDSLSDLIAGAPRKESAPAAVRKSQVSGGAAIMNDPSMGDSADSMCFFKQIMGPGEAEESCEIAEIVGEAAKAGQSVDENNDETTANAEDKQQTDEEVRSLEQLMGFDSDMNVQSADIGQNVEELLQVIKCMENAAEVGNVIDGDGACSDVDISVQSASEGVSEIFADGEGFSLTLLNEVAMMGLVNDNLSDSGVVATDHPTQETSPLIHEQQLRLEQQQTAKIDQVAQNQAQVERRQHDLERRLACLKRRAQKIQARQVGEHAAEETGHVLELAQQNAQKAFYEDLASLGPKAGNTRNFPDLAGNLNSFMQKVEKHCTAQSTSIAVRPRSVCRYFGAGSKDNYVNTTANRVPAFGVPQIKLDKVQVENVAGPLATSLKIIQNHYDSDVTASSSGGESCDEMQIFNNTQQQPLSIIKRASWRYAQDRANVAARWTWLQTQISDLEYKIRQHNEMQRQIRTAKGLVMLEAESPSAAVNGYSGLLPGSTLGRGCSYDGATTSMPSTSEAGTSASTGGFGSSRTRPFVRSMYRKRKLVQLDGLHELSKKAARPATIRCSCDGSHAPCAVCTGRTDPCPSHDALELLSTPERIAAVDPSFHPVLSMPDDVTHTVHMDAIMRSSEWQQKMMRGGARILKLKDKDGNERRNRKVSDHHTKYPARLKKSPTSLITARIKQKVLKGKRSRSSTERTNHGIGRKRGPKQQSQSQSLQTSSALDDEEEASALSSSSKYSSPVPSPLQPGGANATATLGTVGTTTGSAAATTVPLPPPEKNTLKEKSFNSHSHSRLRQNSYDIDNIVIPYSVASATRLEKLPYKEIQIPKWRLCDNSSNSSDVNNGAVQKSLPDSDVEDVSEEAIALRHERSEREENKRFMTFINLPQSRMRHSRRTDSRTDSGANTPDPMSPHASDFGGDITMSPITSPPATPSNVHDSEHSQQQQTETHHRSGSLQNALRRRTMSSSARSQKDEANNSVIEEEHEQVLPYEPRRFPLTDEDYDKMLEAMPGGHLQASSMSACSPAVQKVDDIDSQESDSTESALCDMEGEDPNDPEWTVAEARETEKERIRPTAKR
ncbi:KAT8 regulatory NSL complex subunit 1 isoform X2 [Nasonia vitripennis]|uniref:PEHE domain-containing protein n=1 Tax=Nasonia vitripennis TaxID=7425 RepID=A0A7M7GCG1_NASVI|nr:KAT8 regulatory NSL complex subunit 1 isoform X2 [Nasonia vitripennis]